MGNLNASNNLMKALGLTLIAMLLALTCPQSFAKEKIVSIDGAVSEIIVALDAKDQIVGRDSTSLYPKSITQLPDVGYLRALSVEGVLSLKPDVIVTTSDAGPPETLTMLNKMGVNIHVVDNEYSVEGVVKKIAQIGAIIGKDSNAKQLIESIVLKYKTIKQSENPKSVMLVMGGGDRGFMVAGQHTRANAMIQLTGAKNAMEELQGYKPVTPEAMLAKNPDVILLLRSSLSATDFANNSNIKNTTAAKNNQVYDITDMDLLTFGPRIVDAIESMQALIK